MDFPWLCNYLDPHHPCHRVQRYSLLNLDHFAGDCNGGFAVAGHVADGCAVIACNGHDRLDFGRCRCRLLNPHREQNTRTRRRHPSDS